MKKFLLSLLAVLCSVGMWADDETIYDFASGIGTTDGTSGAPASFTDKTSFKLGGNAQYIIISPASGSFKSGDKIEITGSCGSAGKDMGLCYATTADGRSTDVAVYTAAATKNYSYTATGSLTLSKDASSLYLFRYASTSTTITGIKITRESSKTASDLAVASTASAKIGATTDVTYTTSSTSAASVASSDEGIATATVDTDTKTVSITGVAAGTATITLSQAADDNYLAGSKTITVTVTDPNTLIDYNHAAAVTDGITLKNDENVTIGSAKIHTNTDFVYGIKLNSGYTTSEKLNDNYIELSYEGGFKAGDKVSIAGFFNNSDDTKDSKATLFVKDDSESGYSVLFTTDQFINGRLVDDEPVVQTYVLTADADNLCIGRSGNTATYIYSIKVERPQTPTTVATVSVSNAGYTTYYNSESNYVIPEGMIGQTASISNGKLTLTDTYEAGEAVPAGEPLVLKAAAGDYDLLSVETTATPSTDNILLGTDAETALDGDADSYFYGLTLNAAKETSSVGFYWMKEGGVAFTNGAHKAYLKIAKSVGAKAFPFNEEATGIQSIETAKTTDNVMYDMTGRRVNAAKAGLYIVNGAKKFIK